jgi:hypothetical protein
MIRKEGMVADKIVIERGPDRRRTHRLLIRERRSGFERRHRHRARWIVRFESVLTHFRDHPRALVSLLVLANVFSALDLVLTLILLRLGVSEGNPLMRYLFHSGPVQAAVVKFGLIAAASLAIWTLRRRRAAVEAALFVVGLYGAVVLYEVVGLARLG